MNIEQALQTELGGATAIAALVGQRVYFVRAMQDTAKPYIVLQQISDVPHELTGDRTVELARWQVTAYGATYSECKSIAAAVMTELDQFDPANPLGGVGGVTVVWINCENRGVDLGYDDVLQLYGVAMDFMIMYAGG